MKVLNEVFSLSELQLVVEFNQTAWSEDKSKIYQQYKETNNHAEFLLSAKEFLSESI